MHGYHSNSVDMAQYKKTFFWSLSCASENTRKRIKKEAILVLYRHRLQMAFVELSCIGVSYNLITDNTNVWAISAEVYKYYPSKRI